MVSCNQSEIFICWYRNSYIPSSIEHSIELKMINKFRTSRLLYVKKGQPTHLLLSSEQKYFCDDLVTRWVIVTIFQILLLLCATLLNISMELRGSSINISGFWVFSNISKQCQIATILKKFLPLVWKSNKAMRLNCFRINNFPIKIQIKFMLLTHFCFMVFRHRDYYRSIWTSGPKSLN